MTTTAYLNGQFLPLSEARVPVLDRGYLFGDGVYEVIPVYAGKVFKLEAHLDRLQRSLEAIRLHNPYDNHRWIECIRQLISLNGGGKTDQTIYLQVSRGITAKRAHGLPDNPSPSVLAFTWPMAEVPESVISVGVSAITLEDFRWHRCDIKSIALLANVMLADEALRDGHNEAILHRNGKITEGASSNVFCMIDNILVTPARSEMILHGITREFTLELASQAGIRTEERDISTESLRNADEIWISSSTREIYPVTMLDNAAVGTGKPGSNWRAVYSLYQQQKILYME